MKPEHITLEIETANDVIKRASKKASEASENYLYLKRAIATRRHDMELKTADSPPKNFLKFRADVVKY